MKRWILAMVAATFLFGGQTAKADWIPQYNPDGSVSIWLDPTGTEQAPPSPDWYIVNLYVIQIALPK